MPQGSCVFARSVPPVPSRCGSRVPCASRAILKTRAPQSAPPHQGRDAARRGIAGAVAIVDNSGTAGGCIPDYETIDKSQVQIIVLTLANDQAQTPYLQLMSFISRALRADNGAERLAACKSPDEMRRFFRHAK